MGAYSVQKVCTKTILWSMKHKVGDMVYLRVMPTGAYEVSTGNPTVEEDNQNIIDYVERMATVYSEDRLKVAGWYWLERWVYDKRSLLKDYFSL